MPRHAVLGDFGKEHKSGVGTEKWIQEDFYAQKQISIGGGTVLALSQLWRRRVNP